MTTPPERGIEEEFKTKFGYAGSSGTFTGIRDQEIIKWLHQELQKARHDWLREEIVKLEGEKLGGLARPIFVGANAPERMRIHNQALQTIIDRYQSELDQPKQE